MDEMYVWDEKYGRSVAKSCSENVLLEKCASLDSEVTSQVTELLYSVLCRAHDIGTSSGERILKEGLALTGMLLQKNQAYGDSALSPVRIFSHVNDEEQLLVRIDDKLSRISRGGAYGEDVIQDLIGYLILLRIKRAE